MQKNRLKIKNIGNFLIISVISIVIIIDIVYGNSNFFDNNYINHGNGHSLLSRRMKKFLTKLFDQVLNENNNQQQLINNNRMGKWNEFIDEENQKKQQQQQQQEQQPIIIPLSPLSSINQNQTTDYNQNNQTIIDETKDPNSPYYISMITSNISGKFNRSNFNLSSSSSSSIPSSLPSSISTQSNNIFMTKLFNYAFSTSTPSSRIIFTKKHPLITFLNLTNLDDINYDDDNYYQENQNYQENRNSNEFNSNDNNNINNNDNETTIPYMSSKMNNNNMNDNLSSIETNPQPQQLTSLLNSADPHQSMLQTSSSSTSTTFLTTKQQQQNQTSSSSTTISLIKKRLPECATQQVCSAHYVKSNHTQRLCDCSRDSNFDCNQPMLSSLNNNDDDDDDNYENHVIDLTRKQEFKTKRNSLEVYTQVKLCENLKNIKPCKTPTDWTIMALQSERTGKAHFVVVCKCPDTASFEGPFTHKHPPYARFPGIRVYGMLCNQGIRKSKHNIKVSYEIDLEKNNNNEFPEFPWELAYAVINSTTTQGFW